jgi:hypothetical protein
VKGVLSKDTLFNDVHCCRQEGWVAILEAATNTGERLFIEATEDEKWDNLWNLDVLKTVH